MLQMLRCHCIKFYIISLFFFSICMYYPFFLFSLCGAEGKETCFLMQGTIELDAV